jgi:hypothetical protein
MENMEFLKAVLAEMNVNMKANQAKAEANRKPMDVKLKEMSEEIKSGQAEVGSTVNAWTANMRNDRKETMSEQ